MEQLRWFLDGVIELIRSYLELWSRGISAVAREFQMDLSPAMSDFLALFFGAISLIAFANVVAKWDRKGNVPQGITLKTSDTPDQVVARDFNKFLAMLLRIAVVILLLIVLISLRT